jgi:hypothetical protein
MTKENRNSISNSAWRANSAQYVQAEDAVFIGWQEIQTGDVVALYCVTAAGHPSYGSTVSAKTLDKLNLRIPQIPLLESK